MEELLRDAHEVSTPSSPASRRLTTHPDRAERCWNQLPASSPPPTVNAPRAGLTPRPAAPTAPACLAVYQPNKITGRHTWCICGRRSVVTYRGDTASRQPLQTLGSSADTADARAPPAPRRLESSAIARCPWPASSQDRGGPDLRRTRSCGGPRTPTASAPPPLPLAGLGAVGDVDPPDALPKQLLPSGHRGSC